MELVTMLWENGQDQCVNHPIRCKNRPCTAAQNVFCCRQCPYQDHCKTKCTMKGADHNV